MDKVAVSFLVGNDYNAHMDASGGQAALLFAMKGETITLGARKLTLEGMDLTVSEQTGGMELEIRCTREN